MIAADVGDLNWLSVTLDTHCQVFTASFPCGPWSSMGSQSGLSSEAGTDPVLSGCRYYSAYFILVCFENVPGFRASEQYPHFVEQLELIGFHVLCTVHDLELLSFATRKRWMAVAINTWFLHDNEAKTVWAHPILRRTLKFDPQQHAVYVVANNKLTELIVTAEEWQTLRRYGRDQEVIRAGMVFPTFTASFRDSLKFDRDFLLRKGLFAWMLDDGINPIRWISAIQAARSLGLSASTVLPESEQLAVNFVGNSISPYQAGLMLHYAAEALVLRCRCPLQVHFQKVVECIDRSAQTFALDISRCPAHVPSGNGGASSCSGGFKKAPH